MTIRHSTLLLLLTLGLACTVQATLAQEASILSSLGRDVPGQGRVSIHQDARISALIGQKPLPPAEGEEVPVIKRAGYRIQLYAGGNTRVAKNEAYAVAEKLQELFPDLPVYTSFNPPRWLCRAGDYRSIEEADHVMRQLRATGEFKEVSIVREQINLKIE